MRVPLVLAAATAFSFAASAQDGLTLYQPFNGTTTFLVDSAGSTVQAWPGTTAPGLSVYLLPDGDLIRTRRLTSGGGGTGGGVERLSYDGTVEWQYSFFDSTLTPHHDIEVLPNGNVLMIVWEEVGTAAAIAQGRDPASTGPTFTPDAIYEMTQTGLTTATVVWEWHAFDHLVQDFDNSLPNYGVVADHPERIHINYGPGGDWLHVNGIDYNAEFDQIAISVPNFDEIWIIDHSTTTVEAAGSTGGSSGKGGDLLYRFGNPAAYNRGTAADHFFYFLHDVQWIEPGRPGAGNLIVFNNGNGRPTGNWSSADEWTPPVDAQGNYSLSPGAAYGPSALAWQYSNPAGFYSNIMGGAERLENGNTLICESTSGRLFEVTDAGAVVWNFVNTIGTPIWMFKGRRYADCDMNGVYDAQDIAGGAGTDWNGNGVLDGCEAPVNYCEPALNSTGLAAEMGWMGSTSLAANDLVLEVSDGPASVFGIFAFSPNQGALPAGDGVLCLSSPFSRLQPVVATNMTGQAQAAFDNRNLPPTSPALSVGTTWNFTFWYRDVAGGPAGFNFSDGLSVLFLP